MDARSSARLPLPQVSPLLGTPPRLVRPSRYRSVRGSASSTLRPGTASSGVALAAVVNFPPGPRFLETGGRKAAFTPLRSGFRQRIRFSPCALPPRRVAMAAKPAACQNRLASRSCRQKHCKMVLPAAWAFEAIASTRASPIFWRWASMRTAAWMIAAVVRWPPRAGWTNRNPASSSFKPAWKTWPHSISRCVAAGGKNPI